MPDEEKRSLAFEANLGGNKFVATGDFTFNQEFLDVFRTWLNGQNAQGEKLQELVQRLRASTNSLELKVGTIPPATP